MRAALPPALRWLLRLRYLKFGLVGASGTVVNMIVLYLAQEVLFAAIGSARERLYLSLALAIGVATLNNFTWNRLWTWADRLQDTRNGADDSPPLVLDAATGQYSVKSSAGTAGSRQLLQQFGRYALASWLGIALQYGLTLWLAHSLHYLLANVIAIVIASVSNYLANDRWTFRVRPRR